MGGSMMSESERDLLNASGKIVREDEWVLIIYQREGDKLPTYKLIDRDANPDPHIYKINDGPKKLEP